LGSYPWGKMAKLLLQHFMETSPDENSFKHDIVERRKKRMAANRAGCGTFESSSMQEILFAFF